MAALVEELTRQRAEIQQLRCLKTFSKQTPAGGRRRSYEESWLCGKTAFALCFCAERPCNWSLLAAPKGVAQYVVERTRPHWPSCVESSVGLKWPKRCPGSTWAQGKLQGAT